RITSVDMSFFGGVGRSKLISAKEALRQVHAQRIPITIVTGMEIYESMGMVSARIGRAGPLEQLTIDCEFQKIRKVIARTADVPPERAAPKAKGKAGATNAKAGKVDSATSSNVTPEAGINQSILKGMIGGKQSAAQPSLNP